MRLKAKESSKIQKTRAKLKNRLKIEHKYQTSKILQQIAQNIRKIQLRNHPKMGNLKHKGIFVFDENRHPASIRNSFVLKLQHLIKTGFDQ